ncbi:MAG: neutral/alkaline non-lysosomal ceramidase C-terminal domain-containing protein, partial [Candidatus Hydrogenedentes bacterium]|nr:neutral/alkaline non-lysosomal ceramidase C-terminal domain-containing protein [Candidatus Hydrogenedentota bacterium]
KAKRAYKRGDRVEVTFWSGHPQNAYRTGGTYLRVERQEGDSWITVATDNDWETRCRWTADEREPAALRFTVTWDIPGDATTGTYRIVHFGSFKSQGASAAEPITGTSNSFRVK